jgi:hypothetical protein
MSNKKITDLAPYSASQVKPYDLLFITDIDKQETKKITPVDFASYTIISSGSVLRTGSYSGSLIGNATSASSLTYPNSSTASYAMNANSASYSLSSSYALTASYALNGFSGTGDFSETITLISPHGFSIGDALYEIGLLDGRQFYQANSVYGDIGSGYEATNEVVGIVKSTSSAYTFTIAYSGLVDFTINTPPYFQATNGNAYFLSGSTGKLSPIDPSISDVTQISKPILLKISKTTALIINQRGVYENSKQVTVSDSSSYLIYQGGNNGTSSYAITASYALNGGGGSGSVSQTTYYIDSTPIGTVMAYVSGSSPRGYLPCDGAFVQIINYSELYSVISQSNSINTSFGKKYTYDATSQTYTENATGAWFKLPDLRGVFIRGYNNGLVNSSLVSSSYDLGRVFGDIQGSSVGSFTSSLKGLMTSWDQGSLPSNGATNKPLGVNNTALTDTGAVHSVTSTNYIFTGSGETRPVNISLYYFIKAKQSNLDDNILASVANGTYAVGGDVVGTLNNSNVIKVQGTPVASIPPNTGDVLQFQGGQWTPTPASLNFPKIVAAASFNGTVDHTISNGLQTVVSAYNVASITRNGTQRGKYFVNFASPITGSYFVMGTAGSSTPSTDTPLTMWDNYVNIIGKSSTRVEVWLNNGAGTATTEDTSQVDIIIFK